MTLLHVYFSLRNQQAFQRLLDRDRSAPSAQPGPGPSTSAGSKSKSWTRKTVGPALELNAFDHLGRTVLHLACASTDPASVEYARMLLAHPFINVNLVDRENHWTALHRALYAGNVEAAIMLLKRTDTDTSVKDMEGYTAFDLYNSTVRSANPTSLEDGYADLMTWGANRNAALGLGDSNDRAHPDHVVVVNKDASVPANHTLAERFRQVKVRDVSMSKLHTAILTDESRDNVRVCGFGSGGRLGPYSHTLYTPTPFALSSHSIVSVALGQDHTLALTNAGEVISWGLNRFSQLGYVVESSQGGSADESIQTTPRKIAHLKKEVLNGVAACKTASACWSDNDLWTWGTNGGQLGYSKVTCPVQILPRKASIITQPIRGIAMSETVMMCLFMTGEVVCVWNGGVSKINFPAHAFPSDISMVYRPPQAIRGSAITKLVCCDDMFAALSSNGEVFTFSLPTANEETGTPGSYTGGSRGQVKPQRAWALRRQFSSVRDVDIGGDGALIICTQSGHVYVRSRNLVSSGMKAFKFHRVAHVQRAVAVCANSTGAFGALRVDYKPPPIAVTGKAFAADLAAVAPWILDTSTRQDVIIPLDATEDDLEDSSILDDIGDMTKLIAVLFDPAKGNRHGADLVVRIDTSFEIPAHRVVLAARCIPLRRVLGGDGVLHDKSSKASVSFTPPSELHFTGINPLSLLILFHYIYADQVLAVWDRRIGSHFERQFASLGLSTSQVKADLVTLACLLSLPHLTSALQSVAKRIAKPSAGGDFQSLFDQAQLSGSSRRNVRQDPLAPDVALHLADRTVYTHSVVLRARSGFFAAFFDDPDWTARRRDDAGVVDVDVRHCSWRVMQFVLAFICFGREGLFDTLEFVDNVDELLEFMFAVISAANELLLTRLVLLCSRVVLRYLNAYNACYLLTDAIHFHAVDLADRIQTYMTANMEMLLESRMLDDLDARVVRKLSGHTRAEQTTQSPVSRTDKLGLAALDKHKEWLALQDIPVPIIPSQKPTTSSGKDSPRKEKGRPSRLSSPMPSPVLRPSAAGDEIFAMDDELVKSSFGEETTANVKPGWKKAATPRTDLKAIMAEAENGKRRVDSSGSGAGDGARRGAARAGVGQAGPGSRPSTTPEQGRSDGAAIPRRVPSDLVMPPKLQPLSALTASRPTARPPTTPSSGLSSSKPTMGPVITPVRQTPAASGSRTPSLGGAWTLPPVQPIAAPTVPTGSTPPSFAEIQRSQEMQGAVVDKGKRSLRDIQEEERARQQEAAFLRWWAEEEARVRVEMTGQGQGQGQSGGKGSGGKGRSRKGKDGRGRGT